MNAQYRQTPPTTPQQCSPSIPEFQDHRTCGNVSFARHDGKFGDGSGALAPDHLLDSVPGSDHTPDLGSNLFYVHLQNRIDAGFGGELRDQVLPGAEVMDHIKVAGLSIQGFKRGTGSRRSVAELFG